MRKRLHIGTSGWVYPQWKGVFYPGDVRSGAELDHYATRFRTVEVNSSFYHLPGAATLKDWRRRVPEGFLFAAKASRYVTHMKKLTDPAAMRTFLRRMAVLGDRLGPILLQLPPRWRFDEERLAGFLDGLSDRFRYVFEFRDPSWYDDRALELLERRGCALCIHDLAGCPSPKAVTSDLVYVRLHGPKGPYEGSYGTQALAGWAGALSTWLRQGRTVHCYFNNDEKGYAPTNALRLQEML